MLKLTPIDPGLYPEVLQMSVSDAQQHLVAPVLKTLADAYVWRESSFRVALQDRQPVGCVLVFPFDGDGERLVNIVRLMIDQRFQRRGLGRELLNTTVAWIKTFSPAVQRIRISTLPENAPALQLYESAGFVRDGEEDGETVLFLPLYNRLL